MIKNLKQFININNLIITITISLFLNNFYYNIMLLLIFYILNINYSISLCGMFGKFLYCILKICYNYIIVIILDYILGYLLDKNHESNYDIYVVYTHNNYCSAHLYFIYKKKQVVFNHRFTSYVNV
ncbi:hypothetical protein PFBG_02335 [Plasmodium falciparum 7G8]|uniref:Uncharacterized protein n=1 Tax=Plasmodium falciparum (isolate 7G8) TaxID=57266 RepID=W7F8U0_PLAF8|nr:hypothetical protein PFBG_02335 [Plasmodium falciparum 7G8]